MDILQTLQARLAVRHPGDRPQTTFVLDRDTLQAAVDEIARLRADADAAAWDSSYSAAGRSREAQEAAQVMLGSLTETQRQAAKGSMVFRHSNPEFFQDPPPAPPKPEQWHVKTVYFGPAKDYPCEQGWEPFAATGPSDCLLYLRRRVPA